MESSHSCNASGSDFKIPDLLDCQPTAPLLQSHAEGGRKFTVWQQWRSEVGREVDGVGLSGAGLAQACVIGVEAAAPADAGRHHAAQPRVVGGLHQLQGGLGHVVKVAAEVVVGQGECVERGRVPAGVKGRIDIQ